MRSQTTKIQLKTSVHVHRSVLLTSTSLSLHRIYTSSSRKHFDSLKVEVRDTPLHNRRFAHLCDLFHNLCKWNIHLCDLVHNLCNWNVHALLQFSRFPHPYQIQQLKHRLCVLLNHANRIRTALNGRITCLLQRMIKQLDSPCLLQSTCCVCVNSRTPLVCSRCRVQL